MKKQTKKRGKAVALSLGLAAAMLPVANVSAQGVFGDMLDNYYAEKEAQSSQGLLGRGNRGTTEGTFTHQTFGNDYDGTFTHQTFGNNQDGNFTHQTFGNSVPVGSGMLILLSAGLGYAAAKRKHQNKKNQQVKKNHIK